MTQSRRLLPPAYALIATIIGIALSFVDLGIPAVPTVGQWIGAAMVAVAVLVAARLSGRFANAGTTIKPFQESSALVTDGLYRFSRNPMYVSILTATTGLMLAIGSWLSLVVVPPLAIILDRVFIAREEEMLLATFGEEYASYTQRTRRWI